MPLHRGASGDWADLVYRADTRGRQRVARMVYEVVTFQALREQLRCKEIWVVGAESWRNPDEDLPQDFDERRTENYRELRKPVDPTAFIDGLRAEMTTALDELNAALPSDWCAAAGRVPLPAAVDTVIEFLEECPAAAATWARRVVAVNRVHADAGHLPPGVRPAVINLIRAAAGKPALDPVPVRLPAAQLADLLRGIPISGWPAGLVGRRDTCLLLLTAAGLTHTQCRQLQTGQVEVSAGGGLVVVHSPGGGELRLPAAAEAAVCPACIWLRWARVLAFTARHPSVRSLRAAFGRLRPDAPVHVCRVPPAAALPAGPVFVPADRYGYLDPGEALSVRSISRITHAHLGGTPPTYRLLPPPPDPAADPQPYLPPPASPSRPAEQLRAEHDAALARQRRDRARLAELTATFDDLDDRITAAAAAADALTSAAQAGAGQR